MPSEKLPDTPLVRLNTCFFNSQNSEPSFHSNSAIQQWVLKKNTYPTPPSNLILCASVHVAGLQGRWCLSVGSTDGIRHHTGPRGIMRDTLHPAHLRASATAHRAGVPLTSTPAEEATVGRGQRSADLYTSCHLTVNNVGTCLHGGSLHGGNLEKQRF